MRIKDNRGFSLVELMVAVAIVGLLAAYGVPAYQDYMIRAKVASGLSAALALKEAVANNAANGRPFKEGVGLAPPENSMVKSLAISDTNGMVTVTFKEKMTSTGVAYTLTLVPKPGGMGAATLLEGTATSSVIPDGSRLVWSCRSAEALAVYGGDPALAGTLPGRWAPATCNTNPLN